MLTKIKSFLKKSPEIDEAEEEKYRSIQQIYRKMAELEWKIRKIQRQISYENIDRSKNLLIELHALEKCYFDFYNELRGYYHLPKLEGEKFTGDYDYDSEFLSSFLEVE